MPELYLIRHAKSAWDNPSLADHDRPLNERGRKAAPVIGRWLRKNAPRFDHVLLSSAIRAVETWDLLSAELKRPPSAIPDKSLYLCGRDRLLEAVREIDPDHSTAALIAHNPDMHELSVRLAGKGRKKQLSLLEEKYPTCAVAVLSFAGDWRDLKRGKAELTDFIRPRDLT